MITRIVFRDAHDSTTTLSVGDKSNRVSYVVTNIKSKVKEILPSRHENCFDIIFSKGEILTVFHPYAVLTKEPEEPELLEGE